VALTRLPGDLASASTTPSLTFITPGLCHDGHDATCADGGPGGMPAADAFLREWVPRITSSPADRSDGLLAIVFDEAASDSSACCGEVHGPNTPAPGGQSAGPGGGRTGAVLLSPFIRPGTTSDQQYNHYSLLRSIEDYFGVAPRICRRCGPAPVRVRRLHRFKRHSLEIRGADSVVAVVKPPPKPPPHATGGGQRSTVGVRWGSVG
jgi:hypothetical protein